MQGLILWSGMKRLQARGARIAVMGLLVVVGCEVWQFVAVCLKYNGVCAESIFAEVAKRLRASPYAPSYVIHNSGVCMLARLDSGPVIRSFSVTLDRKAADTLAGSGWHSLAISDAAGFDAGWKPMVKVGANPTVSGSRYCQLLGADVPADGRRYRTVNWGILPQRPDKSRLPAATGYHRDLWAAK